MRLSYSPRYTLSPETALALACDSAVAAAVVAQLRAQAVWELAPGWRKPQEPRAWYIDDALRRSQAVAVIEQLGPLGREAVELGCSLIGSPSSPQELVEVVSAVLADRSA